MKLSSAQTIGASRGAVWAGLMSNDVLQASIPGCEQITGSADEGFEAVVVQKIGPVKATFKGRIELSDVDTARSLTLTGQGQGGAAGFAKGQARVRLEDGENGSTILHYDVNAEVGGKLAQLGSRLIDSFAKKMADNFFERFKAVLDQSGQAETDSKDEQQNVSLAHAPSTTVVGRLIKFLKTLVMKILGRETDDKSLNEGQR